MTSSPALDELAARARGAQVQAGASLEVLIGRLAASMSRREDRDRELNRAVQPIAIPAVQFPLNAGVTTVPTQASLLGPEDGQVWDVRRVTVQGLTGVQVVTLYKEVNSGAVGNPQNLLQVFTATAPTWSPSGGLILRSPDALLLVGSALTVAPVLSGEAVAVEARWLSRYLL